MSRTLLAALGDANDIRTWSGTPYYMLQSGKRLGVLDAGLRLSVGGRKEKIRRTIWNAGQCARFRGAGGYQYSQSFLESAWATAQPEPGDILLNCFQIYPNTIYRAHRGRCNFYIDQTLNQLFSGYGRASQVSKWQQRRAISVEQDQYSEARSVVTTSRWAAEDLIRNYEIHPDKVHVVLPGANLDHGAYAAWCARQEGRSETSEPRSDCINFVFVGMEVVRKGLDRFLRALATVPEAGKKWQLTVVGPAVADVPHQLRHVPGVTYVGHIDKRSEAERFIHLVGSHDVGVLLSTAEASAIALREFHALGLAVIGPNVGGCSDCVIPEASWLVAPEASDEEIRSLVVDLLSHSDRIRQAKAVAWGRRREMHWDCAVTVLGKILACN